MKKITILFFFLGASHSVFAWGDLGHKTIAYLAEKNLTENARAMVFEILGAESLVVASVYADQVRPDERFDAFKPYHYLDLEADQKPSIGKNAHGLIVKASKAIVGKDNTIIQKRFLLRYLIHVIGDVHQPLHVGNGYDEGGNYCEVKWKNPYSEKFDRISLHFLWDEKLFDYFRKSFKKGYFEYEDMAEIVEKQTAGHNFEEKSKLDLELWYPESRALHASVYPDSKPRDPKDRPYCKKGKKGVQPAPVLSEEYKNKALKVVVSQLRLAGLRLSVVLNKIAEGYKKTDPKNSLEIALKSVAALLEK